MRRIFTKSVMVLMSAAAVFAWPMLVQAGAPAASPSRFSYQGFLEQSGSPYNGQADFKASAWDNSVGGAQVTSELELTGVNVNNGVFVLLLDFGGDWLTGEPRWLKISVRAPSGIGDYVDLSPLESINATPYAIQTKGLYVKDDKKVGVFTQYPQAAFEVYRAAGTTSPTLRLISNTQLNLATWMDFYFASINAYNPFSGNLLALNDTSNGDVNLAGGGGNVNIATTGGGTVNIGGSGGNINLANGTGNVKVGNPDSANFMKFSVEGNIGSYSDNASLIVVPGDNYVRVHFNGVGGGRTAHRIWVRRAHFVFRRHRHWQ